MPNWLRHLPLLLLAVLLSGCPSAPPPEPVAAPRHAAPPAGPCGPVVEVDETIPDLSFTTLEGKTVKLSHLKGKIVILDFWEMMCECCVENLDDYQKDTEFLNNPNLYVLALCRDQDQQTVAQFVKEHKWTFPVALMTPESDKALLQGMPQIALPQVRLFDKQGHLRYRLTSSEVSQERILCLVEELGK